MINGSWSAGHIIYIYIHNQDDHIILYLYVKDPFILDALWSFYFLLPQKICSPSKMPNTPMPRCTGKPHGAASVLSQMRGEIQHNPWKRGSVACHRGTESSPCGDDPKVTPNNVFTAYWPTSTAKNEKNNRRLLSHCCCGDLAWCPSWIADRSGGIGIPLIDIFKQRMSCGNITSLSHDIMLYPHSDLYKSLLLLVFPPHIELIKMWVCLKQRWYRPKLLLFFSSQHPDKMVTWWCFFAIFGHIHIPNAPCMVYLPTFTLKITQPNIGKYTSTMDHMCMRYWPTCATRTTGNGLDLFHPIPNVLWLVLEAYNVGANNMWLHCWLTQTIRRKTSMLDSLDSDTFFIDQHGMLSEV